MEGQNLVVRAVKNGQAYEILPIHASFGDFPPAFVHDYIHWLHLASGIVEWRLSDDFWTAESCRWTLHEGGEKVWYLNGELSRLVSPKGPTMMAVAALLAPLEDSAHIHPIYNFETNTLSVHLPRLKLDFSVRWGETELASKQYRDMVVDNNQELGTLTGLGSKLVLKSKVDSSRAVLIPYGSISWEQVGDHVRVKIQPGPSRRVSYHLYHIDLQLGRLVDNGALTAKLFQCYLHALTAHCLPDKLTGPTGTEQALQILTSASTLSQTSLAADDVDLLQKIARLTPIRVFYPKHLRVMQQVKWNDLPALSQHNSFYTLATSFYELAEKFSAFQKTEQSKTHDSPSSKMDLHLLNRASLRNSAYYVDGFGAQLHISTEDSVYSSRNTPSNTERQSRVIRTAELVDQWSSNLDVSSRLLDEIKNWSASISGRDHDYPADLSYDTKWLGSPGSVFPEHLLSACRTLSRSRKDEDKHKIIFFLSTLSYSRHADQQLVETLLAFATVGRLRNLPQPRYTSFELYSGSSPNRLSLEHDIELFAKEFGQCPESGLPQLPNETQQQLRQRRTDQYNEASAQAIEHFVDGLCSQWPLLNVQRPSASHSSTYISVSNAMSRVKTQSARCYANNEFDGYIAKVQDVLNTLFSYGTANHIHL